MQPVIYQYLANFFRLDRADATFADKMAVFLRWHSL